MRPRDGSTWAIVLAGGAGTRLAELTREGSSPPVPKQFCSLRGGRSLLADTFARVERLVPIERTVTIVAAEHERWYVPELAHVPSANRVIQPCNRGTAPGLLLPLLRVLERDPAARVLVLPSDQFVLDEYVLSVALRRALDALDDERGLVLLGFRPDSDETEYGWIVPGAGGRDVLPVARFIEKPGREQAAQLLASEALWNGFLIAAQGVALLGLFAERLPELYARFVHSLSRASSLQRCYAQIDPHDFSREVLEGAEGALSVLPVPRCGWTDLGTPARVAECLGGLAQIGDFELTPAPARRKACLDLSDALRRRRLEHAGHSLAAG